MTSTQPLPFRHLVALALIMALAGCAARTSTVGGLLTDSPASPSDGVVAAAGPRAAPGRSVPATGPGAAAHPPAGTGAFEPAPSQATETAPGGRRLDRIHFAFDSYLLDRPARATLEENARQLVDGAPTPVRVEGHCDERGSAEYNLALGERRAQSAADYLRDLGVSPDRLQTVSYGEERPLDPSRSEPAWASNRRAEFVELAR